ncbi:hypothetical protein D9756_008672 [Leucocoprinus leucothites]|uniref:O-methyltransferase n=1 Tax=Leucocoprinus leucothites TaxID=201217 RepID=A0A8H5CZ16_9AGAR|nr:hypothetical protein D9756_008672 [Leucoagaricus leucothites]
MDQYQTQTSPADWARSDNYFESFLIPDDPVLDATVKNCDEKGLPDIAVSPAQGKFIYLLLRSIGAKRVLELGTLGGYSAIWLAKALPDDGEVVTMELLDHHAKVAAENVEAAGLSNKVKIIVGRAVEELEKLEPSPPFDLVFIDADKPQIRNTSSTQRGLLVQVIVDNVVRQGRVSDPEYTDANAEGVRQLVHAIKTDLDVDSTVIQTVGIKGHDGFLYALRK